MVLQQEDDGMGGISDLSKEPKKSCKHFANSFVAYIPQDQIRSTRAETIANCSARKLSPEVFENKKIKLAKKNEAVFHLTKSLVEVQDIDKDTLEDNKELGRTEKAIQIQMERLKDKVNQSVTEVNHVKMRIKDKKIDEERQVSMLDMKLAKVQEVCNGESRELLDKL